LRKMGYIILVLMVIVLLPDPNIGNDFDTTDDGNRTGSGDRIELWEDLIVTGELEFIGKEILLNGNLIVTPGGILSLINSTLIINTSSNDNSDRNVPQYWIKVEKGAEFNVINSTIKSSNNSISLFDTRNTYSFEIYGAANIIHSNISCLWGKSDMRLSNGGIQVYSNDVLIEDSSIENNPIWGISIWNNSSPSIRNCNISSNGWGGIRIHSGNLIIENSTFSSNRVCDIAIWTAKNFNIFLLNCSLEHNLTIRNSSENNALITFAWFLNVNVIDLYENPVPYANVWSDPL